MSSNDLYQELDFRLKCPFTMLVSGPSKSGKTTFVKKLLIKRNIIFNKQPGKVYWFYKVHQDINDRMEQLGIVNEFVEGMCTMDWIKDNVTENNCTVVIDDMALEATDDTARLFSVGSHHFKINIIFLCQNLFTRNKHFREISLNSTYLILFKNVRDKQQITNFARQFAPGKTRQFAKLYYEVTKSPHSYMMLDYHQETREEHRILSNFLNENKDPIAFHILK